MPVSRNGFREVGERMDRLSDLLGTLERQYAMLQRDHHGLKLAFTASVVVNAALLTALLLGQ